ncbi:hypothetical protein B0H16DRAFT_1694275 [Mycena metata]|uniref:Uncharacterized protein n=1 Tax=Mycena metata TaxID=1033252 RepID=A0AAD7N0U7_9AGAR|nr:hypothetical protein B0H16DRAFT_1694275 [Mycena metata]
MTLQDVWHQLFYHRSPLPTTIRWPLRVSLATSPDSRSLNSSYGPQTRPSRFTSPHKPKQMNLRRNTVSTKKDAQVRLFSPLLFWEISGTNSGAGCLRTAHGPRVLAQSSYSFSHSIHIPPHDVPDPQHGLLNPKDVAPDEETWHTCTVGDHGKGEGKQKERRVRDEIGYWAVDVEDHLGVLAPVRVSVRATPTLAQDYHCGLPACHVPILRPRKEWPPVSGDGQLPPRYPVSFLPCCTLPALYGPPRDVISLMQRGSSGNALRDRRRLWSAMGMPGGVDSYGWACSDGDAASFLLGFSSFSCLVDRAVLAF